MNHLRFVWRCVPYAFSTAALAGFVWLALWAHDKDERFFSPPSSSAPESMVAIIASPARYDGLIVSVVGYVVVRFEGTAVFQSEEDYHWGRGENAIRLRLPDERGLDPYARFDRKVCLVSGVYRAGTPGRERLEVGTLIVRAIGLEPPEDASYRDVPQSGLTWGQGRGAAGKEASDVVAGQP
jgi:hypothetical protein